MPISRLERAFEAHRGAVFGAAYRMLGDVAEAEDTVQETFLRLHESPPEDRERSLEPWLVRVAVNLARDRLRQRAREPARGQWLPAPALTAQLVTRQDPEARLAELQTARLALLHAAEALSPTQRAVYFLRVAFGWSTRETAQALGLSEGATRVALHRARATLEADAQPSRPVDRQAIDRLMRCLAARDISGVRAVLDEQITAFADGGDAFFAGAPLRGADHVMRLIAGLAAKYDAVSWAAVEVNGQLGALLHLHEAPPGWAPRSCLIAEAHQGRVTALRNVMDPRKLEHLPWPADPAPRGGAAT